MAYTEWIQERVDYAQGLAPAAYTPATGYGAVVDMENFRRCAFVLNLGAMTATATLVFSLVEGSTNTPTTAISGKTVTFTAAGGDGNEIYVLEVSAEELDPTSKYVRAKYVLGTANATFGIVNEPTEARYRPV